MAARLARDLHPVAWWIWAVGLAGAATLTTNPLLLALLVATAAMVELPTWVQKTGLTSTSA